MDKIFERNYENLKEMIHNPAAFQRKVAQERNRIVSKLIKSEKISIEELIARARKIKPLIRVANNRKVFQMNDVLNAKESRLYFVKPVDVRQSYFFNFDIKRSIETTEDGNLLEAKKVKEVGRFICYHEYGGYYAFLRPGVDEVLQQLPEDIDIDKISAFEIVFASSDLREIFNYEVDRHVSTVILYELEGGLPEEMKRQSVIVSGVSY